jgi:DNA-3-methyladenine glycosylase II
MNKKEIYLAKHDPVLGRVIKRAKLHALKRDPNHFESLVVAIVNQQLSGKAADTILGRFKKLFPRKRFPAPQDVLKMLTSKMRKAGLSKMKVSFLKDLAKKVLDGTVNFKKMDQWTDEEVIDHLVQVKGIGRWTAEMFLMFALRRDDVFSYGDLGLRNAIKKLYKLRAHPTPRQAKKLSEKWKPYRSTASRYLWASLE